MTRYPRAGLPLTTALTWTTFSITRSSSTLTDEGLIFSKCQNEKLYYQVRKGADA